MPVGDRGGSAVDYVDLQRRKDNRMRSQRGLSSIRDEAESAVSPLKIAAALAPLTLLFVTLSGGPIFIGPPPASLLLILAATSVVLPLLLLPLDRWLSAPWMMGNHKTKLGSEKQLLLALRDLGGLTPVEAALETSLTVDEAEEILTRFVERGHLRVESQDGALLYTLPGRSPAPGTRTV